MISIDEFMLILMSRCGGEIKLGVNRTTISFYSPYASHAEIYVMIDPNQVSKGFEPHILPMSALVDLINKKSVRVNGITYSINPLW